jgi:NAD(P)-dependent dehydrogenase (short-subunit alcohol dehydrogenase family)
VASGSDGLEFEARCGLARVNAAREKEDPVNEESRILEGRVAIVSGIGPGLGRRAAVRLAANGADLAIGARRQSSLDEVAHEIKAMGRRVITLPTDITDSEQCGALAAAAAKEFGRIDVLVNNAFRFDAFQSFEDVDIIEWEKITNTNVFGTLRMTKAVLPYMERFGGGSVIMVASMITRHPEPLQGGYATSKGGLLTATKVLAFELGRKNIRVNAVVPGWMKGPGVDLYIQMTASQRGISEEQVIEELEAPIALGRIPSDEEVAGAIVFLASDLSSAMTGQSVDVNGGQYFH